MKKYLLRGCYTVLLLASIVGLYFCLDYVYSDDGSSQTRVTFHDFYEKENIDTLFLGSSHSVHAIDATAIEEGLDGKSVFSLATTGQDVAEAYYVIREALRTKDIEHVYYELSLSRFMCENVNSVSAYIITDYMEDQVSRAEFLLKEFDTDEYINSFLRLRRNVDPLDLPGIKEISGIHSKKITKEYKEYLGKENYLGNGTWGSSQSCGYEDTLAVNLNARSGDDFSVDDITDMEWGYFLKIIELCKENNVELSFFICPYNRVYIMQFPEYEAVTKYITDQAEAEGIEVIDMNLVKEEYLNIIQSDFFNLDHVNSAAADKITEFLVQYINDPTGDYFYGSLEEKYPNHDDILAVGYVPVFYTEKGSYSTSDAAKGSITGFSVSVSACSAKEWPITCRLWKGELDEETGDWYEGKEITGTQIDEFTTEFMLSYDRLKTDYRVQLSDPATGEVLYETITKFDMN